VVLNDIEQRIKAKIEQVGIPLKDWNINIYRGILTGYNEAFIIDKTKKDELIAEDPKSAEVIRPILRGRDVKRYTHEFADLYLLFIPWHFPIHTDTAITGSSERAEKAFKTQFPAVYNHLFKFKKELSNRNKAETGIRYEWYALQRWGANYSEDFFRPKIVWGEISDKTKFSIDLNGEFIPEATTFLMTGNSLLYLLGYLNSSLSEYLFAQIGTTTGVGTVRWKKFTIEQLRVPKVSKEKEKVYNDLVLKIIQNTRSGKDITQLVKTIDKMLYKEFNLTDEEIQVISGIL
jgi:adenine-specific DNA-methyltransferase